MISCGHWSIISTDKKIELRNSDDDDLSIENKNNVNERLKFNRTAATITSRQVTLICSAERFWDGVGPAGCNSGLLVGTFVLDGRFKIDVGLLTDATRLAVDDDLGLCVADGLVAATPVLLPSLGRRSPTVPRGTCGCRFCCRGCCGR